MKMNSGMLLLMFAAAAIVGSCGYKKTDVRTVIPSDVLIYLESKDLGKTISTLTQNQSFQQLAKSEPLISAISGLDVAIAVTGFETSEEQLTDENSVLNFQPRFVAVAETNAWNYQALSFTETQLGEFVNERYGGGIELTQTDKFGGKYFVWTAEDGRKAYALVIGSLIMFGNDESAIEKCLAVKNGEAQSISKTGKPETGNNLASGFISNDGIQQISNLAGIQFAMAAGEEGEVKSFIARLVPELLRGTAKEIVWTMKKHENQVEDKYTILTPPEVGTIFNETLKPGGKDKLDFATHLPENFASVTRYDFADPQIAWRSVLLTAQKQTDQVSGGLLVAFSGSLFEPYGIEEGELFLSVVGSQIATARFDADDDVVVFARVKDRDKIAKAVGKEIDFSRPPEKLGEADVWRSDGGETMAAFIGDLFILGNAENVLNCVNNKGNVAQNERFKMFLNSTSAVVTLGKTANGAEKIVDVISERRSQETPVSASEYLTQTRFGKNGIERTTVSDFGLVGEIIAQLGKE